MALISSERLYTGRIVNLDRRHRALPRRLHRPAGDAPAPGRVGGGAVPRRSRGARPPRAPDPPVPPRGGGLHLGGAGRPARPGRVAGDLRPARAGGGDRHARPRARAAHHHLHDAGLHRRADPPVPGARTRTRAPIAARPTSSWSCTRSGGRRWGRWCGAGRSRTGRRWRRSCSCSAFGGMLDRAPSSRARERMAAAQRTRAAVAAPRSPSTIRHAPSDVRRAPPLARRRASWPRSTTCTAPRTS